MVVCNFYYIQGLRFREMGCFILFSALVLQNVGSYYIHYKLLFSANGLHSYLIISISRIIHNIRTSSTIALLMSGKYTSAVLSH